MLGFYFYFLISSMKSIPSSNYVCYFDSDRSVAMSLVILDFTPLLIANETNYECEQMHFRMLVPHASQTLAI